MFSGNSLRSQAVKLKREHFFDYDSRLFNVLNVILKIILTGICMIRINEIELKTELTLEIIICNLCISCSGRTRL